MRLQQPYRIRSTAYLTHTETPPQSHHKHKAQQTCLSSLYAVWCRMLSDDWPPTPTHHPLSGEYGAQSMPLIPSLCSLTTTWIRATDRWNIWTGCEEQRQPCIDAFALFHPQSLIGCQGLHPIGFLHWIFNLISVYQRRRRWRLWRRLRCQRCVGGGNISRIAALHV